MNTYEEIHELAKQRLREAKLLLKEGHYNIAFYLAGYSIELTLKAKICEHFNILDLFSEENISNNTNYLKENDQKEQNEKIGKIIKIKNKIKEMVKIHDFDTLMLFCGLYSKYVKLSQITKEIYNNIILINTWNTNIRYKKIGFITKEQAENIILFLEEYELENNKGLLQWIENN